METFDFIKMQNLFEISFQNEPKFRCPINFEKEKQWDAVNENKITE